MAESIPKPSTSLLSKLGTSKPHPLHKPVVIRFVPHDQWIQTHIAPYWKIKAVKHHALARCLGLSFTPPDPPLPFTEQGTSQRPPSPITFAPDPSHRPSSPILFRTPGFAISDDDDSEIGDDDDFDGMGMGKGKGRDGDEMASVNEVVLEGGRVVPSSSKSGHGGRLKPYEPSTNRVQHKGSTSSTLAVPPDHKSVPDIAHLSFALVRFSTTQILEDEYTVSEYDLAAYEILELHYAISPDHYTAPGFTPITATFPFALLKPPAQLLKGKSKKKRRELEALMAPHSARIVHLPRSMPEAYSEPYWEGWIRILRFSHREDDDYLYGGFMSPPPHHHLHASSSKPGSAYGSSSKSTSSKPWFGPSYAQFGASVGEASWGHTEMFKSDRDRDLDAELALNFGFAGLGRWEKGASASSSGGDAVGGSGSGSGYRGGDGYGYPYGYTRSGFEWGERWLIIREGWIFFLRERGDSEPTHSFPLANLLTLRDADQLTESLDNNKRTRQRRAREAHHHHHHHHVHRHRSPPPPTSRSSHRSPPPPSSTSSHRSRPSAVLTKSSNAAGGEQPPSSPTSTIRGPSSSNPTQGQLKHGQPSRTKVTSDADDDAYEEDDEGERPLGRSVSVRARGAQQSQARAPGSTSSHAPSSASGHPSHPPPSSSSTSAAASAAARAKSRERRRREREFGDPRARYEANPRTFVPRTKEEAEAVGMRIVCAKFKSVVRDSSRSRGPGGSGCGGDSRPNPFSGYPDDCPERSANGKDREGRTYTSTAPSLGDVVGPSITAGLISGGFLDPEWDRAERERKDRERGDRERERERRDGERDRERERERERQRELKERERQLWEDVTWSGSSKRDREKEKKTKGGSSSLHLGSFGDVNFGAKLGSVISDRRPSLPALGSSHSLLSAASHPPTPNPLVTLGLGTGGASLGNSGGGGSETTLSFGSLFGGHKETKEEKEERKKREKEEKKLEDERKKKEKEEKEERKRREKEEKKREKAEDEVGMTSSSSWILGRGRKGTASSKGKEREREKEKDGEDAVPPTPSSYQVDSVPDMSPTDKKDLASNLRALRSKRSRGGLSLGGSQSFAGYSLGGDRSTGGGRGVDSDASSLMSTNDASSRRAAASPPPKAMSDDSHDHHHPTTPVTATALSSSLRSGTSPLAADSSFRSVDTEVAAAEEFTAHEDFRGGPRRADDRSLAPHERDGDDHDDNHPVDPAGYASDGSESLALSSPVFAAKDSGSDDDIYDDEDWEVFRGYRRRKGHKAGTGIGGTGTGGDASNAAANGGVGSASNASVSGGVGTKEVDTVKDGVAKSSLPPPPTTTSTAASSATERPTHKARSASIATASTVKPRRKREGGQKAQWIIMDLGSDAAYNSLLRVLHRSFGEPLTSSFLQGLPGLGSMITQCTTNASNGGAVSPPYGPPKRSNSLMGLNRQHALASQHHLSSPSSPSRGRSHSDAGAFFPPQGLQPIADDPSVSPLREHPASLETLVQDHLSRGPETIVRALGALPYPEWRMEVVLRARRAGMGLVGRPVELMLLTMGERMEEGYEIDDPCLISNWPFGSVGEHDLEDDSMEGGGVEDSGDGEGEIGRVEGEGGVSEAEGQEGEVKVEASDEENSDDDEDEPLIFDASDEEEEEESELEWQAWTADLPRQIRVKKEKEELARLEAEAAAHAQSQAPLIPTVEIVGEGAVDTRGINDDESDYEAAPLPPSSVIEEREMMVRKKRSYEPVGVITSMTTSTALPTFVVPETGNHDHHGHEEHRRLHRVQRNGHLHPSASVAPSSHSLTSPSSMESLAVPANRGVARGQSSPLAGGAPLSNAQGVHQQQQRVPRHGRTHSLSQPSPVSSYARHGQSGHGSLYHSASMQTNLRVSSDLGSGPASPAPASPVAGRRPSMPALPTAALTGPTTTLQAPQSLTMTQVTTPTSITTTLSTEQNFALTGPTEIRELSGQELAMGREELQDWSIESSVPASPTSPYRSPLNASLASGSPPSSSVLRSPSSSALGSPPPGSPPSSVLRHQGSSASFTSSLGRSGSILRSRVPSTTTNESTNMDSYSYYRGRSPSGSDRPKLTVSTSASSSNSHSVSHSNNHSNGHPPNVPTPSSSSANPSSPRIKSPTRSSRSLLQRVTSPGDHSRGDLGDQGTSAGANSAPTSPRKKKSGTFERFVRGF
ncbi:hypothetical protein CC1G_07210 [Coprinopsis cinerea okayama7|uniref:Uncharacterized protein n=1 Tax=Coprinopsis cinerea (strain Okayama-7 / 130 / ATCC MYA-4618 / FGSC 9003) TaxID=240176 RepID=A8PCX1_COPC7|nr:hypothetical protein CC1G_07210 [Coprinopsis cinerea okayama7\|eukprot:XP_001840480.2 hypothetical protein CC1G_07210 [Coprinopsis cinerea okayama7\